MLALGLLSLAAAILLLFMLKRSEESGKSAWMSGNLVTATGIPTAMALVAVGLYCILGGA